MAALDELLQACHAALSADAALIADLGTYTFEDTRVPAIFLGYAPDGVVGSYVTVGMEENPDETLSRKRLWYSVDVFDDGASAVKALRICRRIEVIITHLTPMLTTGHFIRAYLDAGPSQIKEGVEKQHFAMDFIFEYNDNTTL